MTKDELIDALEKATGPDRELDARIWCHLNGKKYLGHNTPYGESAGLFVQVEYTSPPKRARKVTNFPIAPHALCVTASIDAALTLVPEGCLWGAGSEDDYDGRPWAWVLKPGMSWDEAKNCHAPTPALAICIAALKARSHD